MIYKVVKKKMQIKGKTVSKTVRKEGIEGTGHTLPFTCGFCKDKDGKPTVAFRSLAQRTEHTSRCTK